MSDFMAYMIKANVAIIFFYAFYRLLIFNNTYFKVRRFSMLFIAAFSIIYPLIDISSWLATREPVYVMISPYLTEAVIVADRPEASSVDIEAILFNIYCVIVAILLLRIVIQFFNIYRIKRHSTHSNVNGYLVNVPDGECPPFSFFNMVFIRPEEYSSEELKQIINHEFTHVREKHSLDVIFGEIICSVFWFNPFVWLLNQEMRVNLEHLADNCVIKSGARPSEYQINLLKITTVLMRNKLVNNFYIPEFKRRIKMMNMNKSNRNSLLKYAFLFPIALLLLFASNARAIVNHIHDNIINAEFVSDEKTVVTGVVKDDKDAPLQGVSVVIANTTKGTITNEKGEYKIEAPVGRRLVSSYVGFAPVNHVKNDQEAVNVTLKKQTLQKDEIVVTGYKPTNTKTDGNNPQKQVDTEDEVFRVVEEPAQFPGGVEKMNEFVRNNFVYPKEAMEKGITGRVIVSYVVNKNGSIGEVKVVKSVDEFLDKAAVNLVMSFPDFIPGKQRGKAVATIQTIPVVFALYGKEKEIDANTASADNSKSEKKSDPVFRVH